MPTEFAQIDFSKAIPAERRTEEARAAYVGAVKAEAARRILKACPEWKQRNLIAQAAILAEKGRANWTEAEHAAWEEREAIWRRIEEIRAASDRLEAAPGMVSDVSDDAHWV
jgi:hypothetical protein